MNIFLKQYNYHFQETPFPHMTTYICKFTRQTARSPKFYKYSEYGGDKIITSQVFNVDVTSVIKLVKVNSVGGIDGLCPSHSQDLISKRVDYFGEKPLPFLTNLCNEMLSGIFTVS